MSRKKSLYDFRGFTERPDASLAESLAVYGLAGAWRTSKKSELCLLRGVHVNRRGGEYDRFAYVWISTKDWAGMLAESWFDLDAVLNFCGKDKEDYSELNIDNLYTAIQYHGTENILGACYHEGFEIRGLK